jgi:hypothetical protein
MREPKVIDERRVRTKYLKELKKAWAARRLVLFLGAGVSQPYGIMNWNDLVFYLLADESNPMQRLLPHYRAALASWLADTYDFSPITLARVVKYRAGEAFNTTDDKVRLERFMHYVRDALYRSYRPNPEGRTSLSAIVELLNKSETGGRRKGGGIAAVVTFNFDNILELKLKERNRQLKVHPVYDATRRDGSGLPIVHVHGYLPKDGAIPLNEFVFTEDDYHRLTYSMFHWSLAEITSYLRNNTVLFIGLSMSDPNLRRLLDATHIPNGNSDKTFKPEHFLIRKEYRLAQQDQNDVMNEVEQRARRKGKSLGRDEIKKFDNLLNAINVMLKEAHSFDHELFKNMGVGTIWVEEFDDIPFVLDEISK